VTPSCPSIIKQTSTKVRCYAGAPPRERIGRRRRYRSAVPDRYDLLVLGDANPDLILTGDVEPAFGQVERLVDDARMTIGGSGAIVACGAAQLGLRVAFCGVVGHDPFGRFMFDELTARGVDATALIVDPERPTGVTVILAHKNDRAILTQPGAIGDLKVERIHPTLLDVARHIHVSSYFLQRGLTAELPGLFERLHARGATTSLDPNWDPAERWDGGLRALFPQIDVFLPNANEAMRIAGMDSLGDAVSTLASETGLVVAKDGADGAVAATSNRLVRAPSAPIDVVDTTGSGDSFDAGFLASWLAGDPLERSLAIGNACGALSARALGGVDAQPTMDEVLAVVGGGVSRPAT
jgi:sugar/nucleoside kinase (ribokinase family)